MYAIRSYYDAHVEKAPESRPDEAILEMKDLGEKVFYGG